MACCSISCSAGGPDLHDRTGVNALDAETCIRNGLSEGVGLPDGVPAPPVLFVEPTRSAHRVHTGIELSPRTKKLRELAQDVGDLEIREVYEDEQAQMPSNDSAGNKDPTPRRSAQETGA